MTNNELNKYIRHYIEKDHTNRAMMLTGPWGCGKSYYIREELIPYLSKEDHGNHSCIVVSLYGLTDLHDVSKAVYMEARFGAVTPKTERGQTASLTAKTVLKGVAGFFGIDLSADSGDLQKLYESVNLAGKLIIFEDVERTQIDIFEFLGYVNNLTEQDGVKVLLVTIVDGDSQKEEGRIPLCFYRKRPGKTSALRRSRVSDLPLCADLASGQILSDRQF